MILFVNDNGEIQDVNTTEKSGLTKLVISDENNPFEGWSVAKICCYKVQVADGQVVMMTPYVDTRIIEQLDRLAQYDGEMSAVISDTNDGLIETYETSVITEQRVSDLETAITELFETMEV